MRDYLRAPGGDLDPHVLPRCGLKWLRAWQSAETEWASRGMRQPKDSNGFGFGYSRFECAAIDPSVRGGDGIHDDDDDKSPKNGALHWGQFFIPDPFLRAPGPKAAPGGTPTENRRL